MSRARVWIWAAIILVYARPTQATYSIAATDSGTRQVGGAVTSCVGTLDLSLVYGSAPGAGVVHAQAQLDNRLRGHDRAVQRLMEGVAPLEIISEITATSFDSAAASRQYGVVDVMGRSAGYTGTDAMTFRDDKQGRVGTFAYSVQGNILTSQKVLDQAAEAFEGRGCDLAERLMLALEAGAHNGEGDQRCTSAGIPSDSAFIEVDRPDESAGSYLRLSVSNTRPDSPLPKLRAAFDAWRATHPCAAVSGGAGAAAGGGSGTGGSAGVRPAGSAGVSAPGAGSGGLASAGAGGVSAPGGGSAGLASTVAATAGGGSGGLASTGGALSAGHGPAAAISGATALGQGGTGRGGTAASGAAGLGMAANGLGVAGNAESSPAARAASGCSLSGPVRRSASMLGLLVYAVVVSSRRRRMSSKRLMRCTRIGACSSDSSTCQT